MTGKKLAAAPPASFSARWGPWGAFFVIVFLAFAPALRNGYVNFDDELYLVANPQLNDAQGLWKIWTFQDSPYYNPLVFTSFWLEKQVQRELGIIQVHEPPRAALNHALNLFLHALGGIFLWNVLRRLGMSSGLAWVAAAIWLIHPLQTQSVVWAVERKNTLSGVFCLAATLLWLKADGQPRGVAYWLSVACFACGLLSKAAFVLLPFVWLLFVWLRGRHIRARDAVLLAPFLAVSVIIVLVTLRTGHVAANGTDSSLLWRCTLSAMSLTFYLWKLVWPVNFAAIYERWNPPPTPAGWLALALWLVLGLVWLAAFLRKIPVRSRAAAVIMIAAAQYVFLLAPVLGLIPFGSPALSQVLNHHAYLAVIGPIVLLVLAGAHWVPQRQAAPETQVEQRGRKPDVSRSIWPADPRAALAAGLLLLLLGGLAFRQALAWKDTGTLTADILHVVPDSPAAYQMQAFFLAPARPREAPAQMEEALAKMQKAVELLPNWAESRFQLAEMRLAAGQTEPALEQLRAALALDPALHMARWTLARVFLRQGEYESAAHELETLPEPIRARPDVLDAWARCCSKLGRHEDALQACDRLLKLSPRNANWFFLRGQCRLAAGQRAAAEADFRAAVQIDRRFAAPAQNLLQNAGSRPVSPPEAAP